MYVTPSVFARSNGATLFLDTAQSCLSMACQMRKLYLNAFCR